MIWGVVFFFLGGGGIVVLFRWTLGSVGGLCQLSRGCLAQRCLSGIGLLNTSH